MFVAVHSELQFYSSIVCKVVNEMHFCRMSQLQIVNQIGFSCDLYLGFCQIHVTSDTNSDAEWCSNWL
jgi:hypothetical protein